MFTSVLANRLFLSFTQWSHEPHNHHSENRNFLSKYFYTRRYFCSRWTAKCKNSKKKKSCFGRWKLSNYSQTWFNHKFATPPTSNSCLLKVHINQAKSLCQMNNQSNFAAHQQTRQIERTFRERFAKINRLRPAHGQKFNNPWNKSTSEKDEEMPKRIPHTCIHWSMTKLVNTEDSSSDGAFYFSPTHNLACR